MSERKLYPIYPLPRHTIVPLPREISDEFKPNMYNSNIYILNPVFNLVLEEEEKAIEEETCVICLENIIPDEIIKPCEICNTYMHGKCFVKYCRTIQTDPLCTTCYKNISLENISIEIRNIIENNSQSDENTIISDNRERRVLTRSLSDEERIYLYKKIKKRIFCTCFVILIVGILILITYAMHVDGSASKRRYNKQDTRFTFRR